MVLAGGGGEREGGVPTSLGTMGGSPGSDTTPGLPSLVPSWGWMGQAGAGTQRSLEQNLTDGQKGEMMAM